MRTPHQALSACKARAWLFGLFHWYKRLFCDTEACSQPFGTGLPTARGELLPGLGFLSATTGIYRPLSQDRYSGGWLQDWGKMYFVISTLLEMIISI